jgi:hypothetical protein
VNGWLSRYSDRLRTDGYALIWGKNEKYFSSPALGTTKHPIHLAQGALSAGAKRPEYETDNSTQLITDIKNGGVMLPLPHTPSRRGAYLCGQIHRFLILILSFHSGSSSDSTMTRPIAGGPRDRGLSFASNRAFTIASQHRKCRLIISVVISKMDGYSELR